VRRIVREELAALADRIEAIPPLSPNRFDALAQVFEESNPGYGRDLAEVYTAKTESFKNTLAQLMHLGVAAVGGPSGSSYTSGNVPVSYRVDISGLRGDLNSVEIRWAANLIESRLNDILSVLRAMRADRIAPQG
jgi:hypothetical protein